MACNLSLCPDRRRFEINQEKNKVFLIGRDITTAGSLSHSVEVRYLRLIADSILQVQVLGMKLHPHSFPDSPSRVGLLDSTHV